MAVRPRLWQHGCTMQTLNSPTATPTRKVDALLAHYGESHRHPTNELIHFVAIPLILWSIVGLLFALHPWVAMLTRETIDECHAAGVQVNTWTCDDPIRMAELIEWGIDGICTNMPDVALDVLAG